MNEFHPEILKRVIAVKSIKILRNICRAEDFSLINRCFSCLDYNYRALDCKNALSCYFCSGEHNSDSYSYNKIQLCVNCIRYNKKLKNEAKQVDVKHKPFFSSCSWHNYMRDQIFARTDYD